jgi:hypothetical protein
MFGNMANPLSLLSAVLNAISLMIALALLARLLSLFFTATTEDTVSLCVRSARHCFLLMRTVSQKS